MRKSAARPARRASAPGIMLPTLLAIALLISVGVLFGQVWRNVDSDRSLAARERQGIEYLRTLVPVATALADAESAAITGRPVPREALTQAVQGTGAVDPRLGPELRTQERWASLRAKIEALPDRGLAGPADALTAYREATDLLLALFDKVRDSSGLVRDPDADSAQLQQVAARDLPNALVGAGRLADAVALASARPASERLTAVADLASARLAALAPAAATATALQSAVDSTQSTELGGHLLAKFDRYQQAVAALAVTSAPPTAGPDANPSGTGNGPNTKSSATGNSTNTKPSTTGNSTNTKPSATGNSTNTKPSATGNGARSAGLATPEPAKVAAARVDAQAAATELSTVVLTELDMLIGERVARLDNQRWLALGAAAVAVLVTLATLARTAAVRRRFTGAVQAPDEQPGPAGSEPSRPPIEAPAGAAVGVQRRREPASVEWPEPMPVGLTSRPAPNGAAVRDNQPAHWGRTDAAR